METTVKTKPKTKPKTKKFQIWDGIKFALEMILIYVVITNSIGLTRVIGHSMDPTLREGSLLLVNKIPTYFSSPKFGDVIVTSFEHQRYDIVKRVIGLPGDKVSIKEGIVYVNGTPIPEVYVNGQSMDIEEVTVEESKLFIIGDNRTPGESLDSRSSKVGTILKSSVKGYVVVSIFPMYKIMKPLEV